MSEEIIHQGPTEVGGETVVSSVEAGYEGPCAVLEDNGMDRFISAFPNFYEARRAAVYATTPDGGYGSTKIVPCKADEITHSKFDDWAF